MAGRSLWFLLLWISGEGDVCGAGLETLRAVNYLKLAFELLFETEELGGFEEEAEAVLEDVVLPAHLRGVVEGVEVDQDLDPLLACRQLPGI